MAPTDSSMMASSENSSPRLDETRKLALWCSVYAVGIIGTLLVYGLLQERIMTVSYSGEMFTVSAFLVLCNRAVNCCYAGSMIKVQGEDARPKAPLYKYFIISMSNVAATTCQYECLKYVAFPVQMLGKSFKMMPVMIWGILISSKSHGCLDWAVAALVTFGVTEFCMTGPMSSPNDNGNSSYGILLLVGFLACDGLTSTMQEKLFKEHQTSKFNQMLYVNGCSAIVSLVSVLAMGKMGWCLAFAAAHGTFVMDAAALSTAAAASQYFIYSQVKEYGALVFAATMNVRQVVSILVSYKAYDHAITGLQVGGLLIIFSALFFKSYMALIAEDSKKNKGSQEEKVPLISNSKRSDTDSILAPDSGARTILSA